MLSFDITDRNVRIIKGTESNGKIRIQSAATLDLEEDVISRGIPKDPPMLATQLNRVLKDNKMADKDAIVSISSNHTIFKELSVPYTSKSGEFAQAVKDKMQEAVNVVDDTYSISYTIVKKDGAEIKEDKSKDGENTSEVTVLATACPQEMIDAYKVVFRFLSINLKSIVVANNCITKVLLSDNKLKQKMPFLAVQIDKNFLSVNLYQDNQLSFSRFTTIDVNDYSEDADYIVESIHENVFRMLQFQKNRSPEPINHVVFYGETTEERYRTLADDMDQMGLTASVVSVPAQITGYENIDFSSYANAVGAMFKRDKDTEKINLLEIGGTSGMVADKVADDNSFKVIAGVSVCAVIAVFAIVGIVLNITNASLVNQINEANDFINSPDTIAQLEEYDNRTVMLENVRAYKDSAKLASDAYKSRPVIESEIFTLIDDTASSVDSSISIGTIDYSGGTISIPVTATGKSDEYAQSLPSTLVQAFLDTDAFYNVDYTGYSVASNTIENQTTDEDGNVTSTSKKTEKEVSFQLTMNIKSDSDSIAEEYESAADDEASVEDGVDGEESAE
jgi:type IV pilus assembly protein PilM